MIGTQKTLALTAIITQSYRDLMADRFSAVTVKSHQVDCPSL